MWATNHAEITRENSERERERAKEERLGDEPTTANIQKTSALRHAAARPSTSSVKAASLWPLDVSGRVKPIASPEQ